METGLSQLDQERLSAWMDGELDSAEAEIVARLVETDATWTAAYKQLQSLDATLSQWTVPAPPADLTERVLSHARRKPEPVVLRVGRWILSAAAMMLIAVGAWQYFAQNRPVTNPTQYVQGNLPGVSDDFVRENAGLFHNMPENVPAKGPVRFIITNPGSSTTQPAAIRVLSWNQLNPEQQKAVRQRAVIFLRLTPEQQVKLLRAHERAMRAAKLKQQMSWLKPVIESFTPKERAELQKMTPAQRSEKFLQRRKELLQSGILSPKVPENQSSPFLSPDKAHSPDP